MREGDFRTKIEPMGGYSDSFFNGWYSSAPHPVSTTIHPKAAVPGGVTIMKRWK
ncbi:MAG: hypothetical protein LBU57_02975 [Dysgonamonadaceae bacterium]|nr:hypothetical protein [Dysgonamonadaceae bacterium]